MPEAGKLARHTTEEMLTVERFVLDTALAGRGAGVGLADLATVDAALAERPGLHPEQVTMVRRLTTGGDAVQVVVGKAGSGKSLALAAAAQAWTACGLPVSALRSPPGPRPRVPPPLGCRR